MVLVVGYLVDKFQAVQQELLSLVDSIPQTIVVLERDGTLLYANRTALEYTGLTLEEVLVSGSQNRFFHPDDEFAQQQRREGLSRGAPSGSGQSGGSLELGARGETVKHLWTHAGQVNRELVSALAWLWTK